jgi:hypothetical protein
MYCDASTLKRISISYFKVPLNVHPNAKFSDWASAIEPQKQIIFIQEILIGRLQREVTSLSKSFFWTIVIIISYWHSNRSSSSPTIKWAKNICSFFLCRLCQSRLRIKNEKGTALWKKYLRVLIVHSQQIIVFWNYFSNWIVYLFPL